MTEYDTDYFREKFPNLFEEIKNQTNSVRIDGVRTDSEEAKKATQPKRSLGSTVVDFMRLCDTENEAVEIINYMENERKIDSEYAKKLRNQLTHQGLRSFGSKRKPGEYPFTE